MKNQAYRMALLFDFYGETLTDRQKEFYDLYYNEDLSLAEIAENYGISRQGVRDIIVRAEGILVALEDKTGIIKRFHKMQEELSSVSSLVQTCRRHNSDHMQDAAIDDYLQRLEDMVNRMKQE